ncbi:MAG TPA: GntR family transcriptional regulator [Nocardioides sp.]|nr:GntR family transcriptional regulator [Nocardioides sp.]
MAIQFFGRATAAVFAPLESSSRSARIAQRLTDAIALGLLPDAQQLPGEADLAQQFGVSTVTVREALSVLRHEGLIETRRGRGGGSFVQVPPDGAASLARRRLAEVSLLELRDLGDVYAAIAGRAAALAARRADDEDVAQLRRVAAQLAEAGEPDARRRADAQFHIQVTVAAQSARLYQEEVHRQAEFGTLLWLAFGDDASHAAMVETCTTIVDAIAARDAATARETAEQRVTDATARLIDYRLDQEL